jgi:hypothetical protein
MGEIRGACSHFVKKPAGNRPLGRPRLTWEDNIKTILKKSVRRAWSGLIRLRIRKCGRLW